MRDRHRFLCVKAKVESNGALADFLSSFASLAYLAWVFVEAELHFL
jgi:hypothetical protein